MASYTVRAAKHATLVASTVDVVTLTGQPRQIIVVNRDGAGIIYFTVNGDNPTVAGDDTYVLPAVVGALSFLVSGPTVVRLISSGIPSYSVQAL